MARELRIPQALVFVAGGMFEGEDHPGYVLYAPAHVHYAGDGLPCSASILMIF